MSEGAREESAPSPILGLRQEGGEGCFVFEVRELAPERLSDLTARNPRADGWSSLFSITTRDPARPVAGAAPPLMGRHAVEGDRIVFRPRFALAPGIAYEARFDPRALPEGGLDAEPLTEVFQPIPPLGASRARVLEVHPTVPVVPENLLKLYIEFSEPMSRGAAHEHVHLIEDGGRTVQSPFLALDEELWDPSGRRLTLFFHPGRVKRGLRPREEEGPILEAGKSYTLIVGPGFRDASGATVDDAWRRDFAATRPDETSPDPSSWSLSVPAAGTRDPLVVELGESLDHALLERVVHVRSAEGDVLQGDVHTESCDSRWVFVPDDTWSNGTHELAVANVLEDLAANTPRGPFEVDVFKQVSKGSEEGVTVRSFVIEKRP